MDRLCDMFPWKLEPDNRYHRRADLRLSRRFFYRNTDMGLQSHPKRIYNRYIIHPNYNSGDIEKGIQGSRISWRTLY